MTRRERWRPVDRQGAVRSALLIAFAALLAACGSPATSPSGPSPATPTAPPFPTRICEGGEAPISCTEAIGKVLLAMGPDAASVQAAWFRPGAPCPPNARCMAPPPGNAYVVVRLDGAQIRFVPLRVEGDETVVGVPDRPTFDLWPPSGEAIPPVGEPDLGPEAPLEVAGGGAMPLCGEEQVGVTEGRVARRCFFGAVLDGRPAEFVSRSVDDRGDPFVELYRFDGRGPVLVYRSASFVGPGWVRNDCAIGPAFDDAAIFVVAECVSTELS